VGNGLLSPFSSSLSFGLLEKCDAVLRMGGASLGADEMVRVGQSLGLKIYCGLDEIPALK